MQGTEHDIAFFLALGCAIALHCIALHCIVVHCIALYCSVLYCIPLHWVLLDGMASARRHRMRGTEHDIALFLALGCAIALHCIALHCIALHCIALHCIALHCIVVYCIALHFVDVSGLVSGLDSQSGSELPFVTTVDQIELRRNLWSAVI